MRTLKIKTTQYTKASKTAFPGIFFTIVQSIIAQLDTVFMGCPYTQEQMQDEAVKMYARTTGAIRAGDNERNFRDQQRTICESMLNRLSNFTLDRASQEPTLLQQISIVELAKFTVARSNQRPVVLITAPTPKAEYSHTLGTIHLKWKSPKRVQYWIIEHVAGTKIGPTADWKYFANSHICEYTASGLSSGYHSFRLIGVTASGASGPSDAAIEYAR